MPDESDSKALISPTPGHDMKYIKHMKPLGHEY